MLYRFEQSCSWFHEVKFVIDQLNSERNNRKNKVKVMIQRRLDF